MSDECLICRKPVDDYEPEMCCGGFECGCMGQPLNPCVCSQRCCEAIFSCKGTFEDRRISFGIHLHPPNPSHQPAGEARSDA